MCRVLPGREGIFRLPGVPGQLGTGGTKLTVTVTADPGVVGLTGRPGYSFPGTSGHWSSGMGGGCTPKNGGEATTGDNHGETPRPPRDRKIPSAFPPATRRGWSCDCPRPHPAPPTSTPAAAGAISPRRRITCGTGGSRPGIQSGRLTPGSCGVSSVALSGSVSFHRHCRASRKCDCRNARAVIHSIGQQVSRPLGNSTAGPVHASATTRKTVHGLRKRPGNQAVRNRRTREDRH